MKAEVTKISSNQVKIDIEVEPELFETGMAAAYRQNVKRINVQGFRKGKAPRKLIELQYGESIFYEDAIEHIFPGVYEEAIKTNGIRPVDRPEFELTSIGKGQPLVFSVTVYVHPDVTLGRYKGLAMHRHVTEVAEDDIKAEIERARERAATFTDVTDRPVKLDDQITLNYKGCVDGEPFEGGEEEGHTLNVGSGSFIPGFEDQLVGAQIDEELKVSVTFPEDYHEEPLRGKPAVFDAMVTAIREKELPGLDDEFAKDVSEFETFEEYREGVRAELRAKADERDDRDFENQIVGMATDNAEVDIPERMIEDRIERMMRDFQFRLLYQGMSLESYYQYSGNTEESLKDQMRPEASAFVKTQLVVEAIAEAEGITVDAAEMDGEIDEYISRTRGDADDFRKTMDEDDRERFVNMVKSKKAVEVIKRAAVEPDDEDDSPDQSGREEEETEKTDE